MQFQGIAILLASIGLMLLVVMIRVGWRLDWLLAWIRGCALLLLLGLAGTLALIAWEMQQFRPVAQGKPIAVMVFKEAASQRYEVTLTEHDVNRHLQLEGDTWELQVQILRWNGLGKALGLSDGYRLARLNGRYVALEQQRGRNPEASGHLYETPQWRDLWHWLDTVAKPLIIEADAYVVRYMPMTDGARFAIDLNDTGLTPAPLNPVALQALKDGK